MLRGIDISSWQGDIDLSKLDIDFVIIKATEAQNYVNPYCDPKVQQAKKLGLKWGFYHFAQSGSATAEADYFIEHTSNYFGEGIPVLDWEVNQSVAWVNEFVKRIHDKMGVWPWIYANPWRFNQSGVEKNCARWIASYPSVTHPDLSYKTGEVPRTDGLVACWQYASDGRISGYAGDLDLNHFYGDEKAWDLYAGAEVGENKEPETSDKKTITVEDDEHKVIITEK